MCINASIAWDFCGGSWEFWGCPWDLGIIDVAFSPHHSFVALCNIQYSVTYEFLFSLGIFCSTILGFLENVNGDADVTVRVTKWSGW